MQLSFIIQRIQKRYPLTISRGTSADSDNLFVRVEHEGVSGWGEMSPVSAGVGHEQSAELACSQLQSAASQLLQVHPADFQTAERITAQLCATARAALDFAMFDWLGRSTGQPVWRLLGNQPALMPPTSLTIGINPPEVVAERTREMVSEFAPKCIKIKLGSPDGCEHDRAVFTAVQTNAPSGVSLRVDANGGWDTPTAKAMMHWLAERGAEYVEQPLPRGAEEELPLLYEGAPIPIYADESCHTAPDVVRLADRVHGINLKLMKSGGIREGLRVIHTARAHGLKVMMGCMSETSLAISASAAIGMLCDELDLDSHLNLSPDPWTGLGWREGVVVPSQSPGLGVIPNKDFDWCTVPD